MNLKEGTAQDRLVLSRKAPSPIHLQEVGTDHREGNNPIVFSMDSARGSGVRCWDKHCPLFGVISETRRTHNRNIGQFSTMLSTGHTQK
jgi:hypothetical protein